MNDQKTMTSLFLSLFGFLSPDLLHWFIKKGWHDSLSIEEFKIRKSASGGRTGGPMAFGVHCEFILKNKLTSTNNVTSVDLLADGNKAPYRFESDTPVSLTSKELRKIIISTGLLFPGELNQHRYVIIVSDNFGRKYSREYVAA